MSMFCRQCEQTFKGTGCTQKGVCGKSADVSALQDLLIHAAKAVAVYAHQAKQIGIVDAKVDRCVREALFVTVTNVNFDPAVIIKSIRETGEIKENIKGLFLKTHKEKKGQDFNGKLPSVADWQAKADDQALLQEAYSVGLPADSSVTEDIQSLREILLYGMKGMAAYADHAAILGVEDESVNAFLHKGMAALVDDNLSADELVGLVMEFGMANLKCMEILDKAHTDRLGHPEPTVVYWGTKKGPAIIVSGHDMLDMEILLEQTKDRGVNVYTHGEMLPAHAYPKFKKYPQLVGHFGTAWQNQQKEFDNQPAVVLMTTNCIQEPRPSYHDRIFTTGLVGWPDVTHITAQNGKKDFSALIEKAEALGGFQEDKKEREITIGFGHNTVLGIAKTVVGLVKEQKIRHFFLIGGCDGAKPGRNYFSEFAQKVPQDCLILTLACGKFRINQQDYGTLEGLPRLLDCGQCNDAYSAIKIASALAEALRCGVNDLPLSLILSWYEQKAVCILLTLLALGIKNIRLGPTLPAFISPNVLNILVEKFNIQTIGTVEKDLETILQPQ